jgi:hypothetical protein
MKNKVFTISLICFSILSYAQQLNWTGNVGDNDFFNEQNWVNTATNQIPSSGTIDAGVGIDFDLQIQNYTQTIVANGSINLGSGSLSLTSTKLFAESVSGGNIELNNEGYLDLSSESPFQNNVTINFSSGIAWVRTLNLKGTEVQANNLNQITVNLQPAQYPSTIRLDNYYLEGTVIRSNALDTTPLRLYNEIGLQGTSVDLSLDIIHSGAGIGNNLNNSAESLILKKGFMATVAVSEDGTGKSKNYIASEEDLIIDELPEYLKNDISFIRVIPWNWVNKKGRTGPDTELNNTWKYLWSNTGNSSIELEYAPMSWGYGGANDDSDIELYKSKYKATHVMAFNEADNCDDQSGQFNNLCDTDVAVNTYKNLMKTGLRLVSPSCRENAPFGWLREFHDKANLQDIRIDVIAVHWYDWGSGPTNSPNADPQAVFNRFVTYLENVHNLYGLPIWITEFNANPNRSTATNYGFMQLALPYLESLDYVERYVWYQPNSGVADYYDDAGTTLTDVGVFYRDQVSVPSIPEATLEDDSNLDIYYDQLDLAGDNLLVNGDFELGNLTGWNGSNIGTLSNANVYQGTTSGRILANEGNIYQLAPVEPLESYNLSFYTKWFVPPSEPIEVQILDASNDAVIASQLMTTSTEWNLVELDFTVPEGITSIKFIVQKGQEPGWFIDNAVLINADLLNINDDALNLSTIYPNPSQGVFNLTTKANVKSYKVFDMRGQLVVSKNNVNSYKTVIDLSNRNKGVYVVTIDFSNGNQANKKLIIK